MTPISRNLLRCSRERYDVIIVGGGIYGISLSLEASRRGLRSLLVEKADFGGKTSFNSLRILHGGLRYLQTADFKRFHESVGERRWFQRTFPQLVSVMPCLMPLYGKGAKRPAVFRCALAANDILSLYRNRHVDPSNRLPRGRVVPAEEVRRIFPAVDTRGLKGGAIWYDVCMPDSQRVLMEMLRWSCRKGGRALNYLEATGLKIEGNRVTGIQATDAVSGENYSFGAPTVINAAGPWCRPFMAREGIDHPELFRASLAWNALFDVEAISSHALAVTPKIQGARTYFLVPWKGKLLAGTGHAPYTSADLEKPLPAREQMDEFIYHLNTAIPSLGLRPGNLQHVFAGLLPARSENSAEITKRPVVINHQERGGPHGLFSVSGVKFTTARLVADRLLQMAFGKSDANGPVEVAEEEINTEFRLRHLGSEERSLRAATIVEEESVVYESDLIFRRTDLWELQGEGTPVVSIGDGGVLPDSCSLVTYENLQ